MRSLPEDLLLVALDKEKGTVGSSSETKAVITYALTAAIIMELMLAGRVRVEEPVKKFLTLKIPHGKIVVLDPAPTGDEILDDALARIRDHGKVKGPFYWIDKLGPVTASKDSALIDWSGKGSRFLARLAAAGILYKQEHRTLGLVSTPRFRLMDADARNEAEERVKKVLLEESTPSRRDVMLVALVRVSGVMGELFPERERLRQAREREAILREADSLVAFLVREIKKVRTSHDAVVYS